MKCDHIYLTQVYPDLSPPSLTQLVPPTTAAFILIKSSLCCGLQLQSRSTYRGLHTERKLIHALPAATSCQEFLIQGWDFMLTISYTLSSILKWSVSLWSGVAGMQFIYVPLGLKYLQSFILYTSVGYGSHHWSSFISNRNIFDYDW